LVEQADIHGLLNPKLLENACGYAAGFATARPFPHVVIDGFLNTEFCADICHEFPAFSETAALNEDGRVGGKAVQEKVRSLGSAYERMDDLVQSPEFIALVERITGIHGLCYDPWYFGGGTHENRQGQDLDPHIDFNYHPITRQHRRLNLIIYLNEHWDDRWGGALQLHSDPRLPAQDDDVVTVTPLMNRCVIFETSERSWHGFDRIELPADQRELSRKSFAIYFYSDTRPAAETADEHSTVYVERRLPARFMPGHTLDEVDVGELQNLLGRRDQHLQRLYRQLQEANGRINRSRLYQAEMRFRRRIHELERSTSWPVTRWLRSLKRALGRGEYSGAGSSRQND
jgi:hypothetical protein